MIGTLLPCGSESLTFLLIVCLLTFKFSNDMLSPCRYFWVPVMTCLRNHNCHSLVLWKLYYWCQAACSKPSWQVRERTEDLMYRNRSMRVSGLIPSPQKAVWGPQECNILQLLAWYSWWPWSVVPEISQDTKECLIRLCWVLTSGSTLQDSMNWNQDGAIEVY